MQKIALVTGGVRNSGLAIARRFAAEGWGVCLTSRKKDDAEKTAREIARAFSVPAKGYALDLEDEADIARVFADVRTTFGRLDAFVANSANLGIGQTADDVTPAEFRSVFAVNVFGSFFAAREAAALMAENGGGSVVFIGSVHAYGAVRGRVAYAASKGALSSLVHNLAYEWAEKSVRVNQVVPGAIRTDRWDGISPEEEARRRANWPLGVESTGEDIANAVYFLASDQSRTVTGSALPVDSGILSCLLKYEKKKEENK